MAVKSQATRRAILLGKNEATYGVEAEPTPASNATLINSGIEIKPNADKVTRDILRNTFSPAGSYIGAKSLDLSFTVEARGGGLDAQDKPLPPDYDWALLACGMQRAEVLRLSLDAPGAWQIGEVVTGGTSAATGTIAYVERDNLIVVAVTAGTFEADEAVTGGSSAATGHVAGLVWALMYRPITADIADIVSASCRFWRDAILHRVLGAIGTFSLSGEVGKIATIEFKLSGLWADPVDQAIPGNAVLTDMTGAMALAMGVRIGTYTPVANAIKLDLANKVQRRQDLNAPEGLVGFYFDGRDPTGSLDPEVDALASYNPWSAWKSGAKTRINGYFGSTPGNRIAFHVGAAQVTDLAYKDRNGVMAYDKSFQPCQEYRGDDEMRLVFF
jgi:hypothetical protein